MNEDDVEKVKTKLIRVFERHNLKLEIQVNKTVVNYLDITLDLATGEYRPATCTDSPIILSVF